MKVIVKPNKDNPWRWEVLIGTHVVGIYPTRKWAEDEFYRIVKHGATADDLPPVPAIQRSVRMGKPFNRPKVLTYT
jgi:hypothetical protein